jgi:hypothetical protein
VSTLYFSQAPVPSHRPSVPQDALPASRQVLCGSAAPAAALTHLPSEPGRPQLRHEPVQADSQQTPSAQMPGVSLPSASTCPAHTEFAPHFWPRASSPLHCPISEPAANRHGCVGAQSLSDLQVVLQAPFAQR